LETFTMFGFFRRCKQAADFLRAAVALEAPMADGVRVPVARRTS
jgi:hypothetical protein